MKIPNQAYSLFCLTLMLAFAISNAEAAKLYKVVGPDGKVSYQSEPPPDNANVEVLQERIATTGGSSPEQEAAAADNPVVVYTIEDCDSCEMLLLRLRQLNIPTREDSMRTREAQARILAATDSLQAPSVFIGDKFIADTSEAALVSELEAAGYEIGNTQSGETRDLDNDSDEDSDYGADDE